MSEYSSSSLSVSQILNSSRSIDGSVHVKSNSSHHHHYDENWFHSASSNYGFCFHWLKTLKRAKQSAEVKSISHK